MIPNVGGFFDNLEHLTAQELRKKGSIRFLSKREKMQFELERINERQRKLEMSKAKKEADLQLLDDEQDDFRVKISLSDFELLKQAKLHAQANPMVVGEVQQEEVEAVNEIQSMIDQTRARNEEEDEQYFGQF